MTNPSVAATASTSRVVAITGGGGGVGLAAAQRFGREQRVVLGERDPKRLDEALATLRDSGIDATGAVCDVTDQRQVEALVSDVQSAGELTVLFHTAGLSPSMGDASQILRVNYLGTAVVVDAFMSLLRPGAVFICVASMAAYRSRAVDFDSLLRDPREEGVLDALVAAAEDESRPAYALSKRGVIRICEDRAASFAEHESRILSISPGVIDTEMGRLEMAAGARGNPAAAVAVTALRRLATADEIAGMAELLAKPAASYVTGCDVLVDGGTIAGYRHHAPRDAREAWDDPWKR
jgi:NAD(P)-dependent dehydrogenase (short-subunit alcohol dehydrogenase family)